MDISNYDLVGTRGYFTKKLSLHSQHLLSEGLCHLGFCQTPILLFSRLLDLLHPFSFRWWWMVQTPMFPVFVVQLELVWRRFPIRTTLCCKSSSFCSSVQVQGVPHSATALDDKVGRSRNWNTKISGHRLVALKLSKSFQRNVCFLLP